MRRKLNNENKKKIIQKSSQNISKIDKVEFFEMYKRIKKGTIKIDEIDKETAKKILLIAIEEIDINNAKIRKKFERAKVSSENIKIYDKEIQVLRKNKNN